MVANHNTTMNFQELIAIVINCIIVAVVDKADETIWKGSPALFPLVTGKVVLPDSMDKMKVLDIMQWNSITTL